MLFAAVDPDATRNETDGMRSQRWYYIYRSIYQSITTSSDTTERIFTGNAVALYSTVELCLAFLEACYDL